VSVVSVYTVFADADEAEVTAGRDEDRLFACVNLLGPVRPIYRWKARSSVPQIELRRDAVN
jgi:periplasmic divalent cation tolerance protein